MTEISNGLATIKFKETRNIKEASIIFDNQATTVTDNTIVFSKEPIKGAVSLLFIHNTRDTYYASFKAK